MRRMVDIYWVQLQTQIAVHIQYRASALIWFFAGIVEPVMFMVVWTTVAGAQGGQVEGYSAGEFAAYFIIFMLVNHATFTWIMWEYGYLIREGTLSGWLLRPLHPIHRDVAQNLAYKVMTLVAMIPATIILIIAFDPTFNFALWSTVAFVPALIFAMVLRFLVEWMLAMAAFWTTRVSAINELYFVALLFFSGQLAPLTLFPAPVQAAAWLLPFRWMLYFPVELLLGRVTPEAAVIGYAAQVAWIAGSSLLLMFVWRRGVRQFSAVGA